MRLDEVEALDGDEELVVARVAQLEKILSGIPGHTNLLESDEHPDTVIDVYDEIPDLEIAQV